MGERERLKQTGKLPGVQTILEWHGLEVSKAIEISNDIQKAGAAGFFEGQVQQLIRDCESPAERQFMLGLFLLGADAVESISVSDTGEVLWLIRKLYRGTLTFGVSLQFEVANWEWECPCVGTGKEEECEHEAPPVARCDFRFFTPCGSEYPSVELIVEIDGHDFHDRTKEQAARDRARDRAILAQPYAHNTALIRFTAAEVFADPAAVAREALGIFCGRVIGLRSDIDVARKSGLEQRDDLPPQLLGGSGEGITP